MKCLVRCYCGKCKQEFTDWIDKTGHLKPECPECKGKTDYDEIFELETLQVG